MARKEVTVVIEENGIEYAFEVRQMSAHTAFDWGLRAIQVMASAGIEFPEGVAFQDALAQVLQGGASTLVKMLGGIDVDKTMPLLDRLLLCCFRQVGNHREQMNAERIDNVFSDFQSLFTLYIEVLSVNFMRPESQTGSASSFRVRAHGA